MNYLATIVYALKKILDGFGGSCTMGIKLNEREQKMTKYKAEVITGSRVYSAKLSSRKAAIAWADSHASTVGDFETVSARRITSPSGNKTVEY
jgi:hypothetical protein